MEFLCRNPEEEQLYNLVCLSTVSMMQDSATFLPISPGELKVSGVDAQACQKLQALCCKKKKYDIINYLDACGYNLEF